MVLVYLKLPFELRKPRFTASSAQLDNHLDIDPILMLSAKQKGKIHTVIVAGMTRLGIEPPISRTEGEHSTTGPSVG